MGSGFKLPSSSAAVISRLCPQPLAVLVSLKDASLGTPMSQKTPPESNTLSRGWNLYYAARINNMASTRLLDAEKPREDFTINYPNVHRHKLLE
jgi:hypothetical protein